MTLPASQRNLAAAKSAVRYVRSKMKYGARNKLGDLLRSGGASWICVWSLRTATSGVTESSKSWCHIIDTWGRAASRLGCGNCAEQAALGFNYLKSLGTRPIDYMMRTKADHAFVVIGRSAGSQAADPKTWGSEAVICDPYEGTAYLAHDAPAKMKGPFQPRTLCRGV